MALKVRPDEAAERVAVLVEERRKLEQRACRGAEEARHGRRRRRRFRDADAVRTVGDVKLLARSVGGIDMKDLKGLADEGKRSIGSGIVAIVNVADDGKAGLVVGVTDDLTGRFSAVDLVRRGAEALGGKGGGGRPDMAQAGGPDGGKAGAALDAIEAAVAAGWMPARRASARAMTAIT